MKYSSPHTFHIPVMGIAFTVDTPLKVGHFGISSVISIMEDYLIERMREEISRKENLPYTHISEKETDHRAKRITAYLNLLNKLVTQKTDNLRNSDFDKDYDINHYFKLLPEQSLEKKLYQSLGQYKGEDKTIVQNQLRQMIVPGSIDVNIMTKVDRTNYDDNGLPLGPEYNDAVAALRGYAESELESSVVFSAGMNPRLFSFCEKYNDFYPDENGIIKKKIILKVSDYRSALIQGKYLAKKGLWVSEYRIESGINCGGHAFVSNGLLMGPILEEFKLKREALYYEVLEDCNNGLIRAGKQPFTVKPRLKVTAQGGIGTYKEHKFLLTYFNLDSIGWGSPFLLVPEATNVDYETLHKLSNAKKSDYYLSHSSPLGIPFNNFRKSSSEAQRLKRISAHREGSPCYKKFLSSNTEFTKQAICTASRQYQKLKIDQLKSQTNDKKLLAKKIESITEKDCLCEGLSATAYLVNKTRLSHKLSAVAICPGPNLAYFTGIFNLKQMIDHIYGRVNLLNNLFRPNCFINEIELYTDYLKNEFKRFTDGISEHNSGYFEKFRQNIMEGICYYEGLVQKSKAAETIFPEQDVNLLQKLKNSIKELSFLSVA